MKVKSEHVTEKDGQGAKYVLQIEIILIIMVSPFICLGA